MRKLLKNAILFVLVLSLLLSTCACEKEDVTKSEGKYGGTYRFATVNPASTMFLPKSSNISEKQSLMPALEPLGRLNTSGDVEPWLAESFTIKPEDLTFTIKLKDGIKFTDGSKLNAEALKWNIQVMLDNGKSSTYGNPTSIDIVDALTVKVNFKEWSSNWLNTYADIQIMSKEAYDKNGGADWAATHMVGTGPYKLNEFVPGNKITYVKNEEYHIKGKPYLDAIEIYFMKDTNTQISAFMANDLESLMTDKYTLMQTIEAAGYKNSALVSPQIISMPYLMFNSNDPAQPFYDVNVRKAVMHSIDWEGAIKVISGGFGSYTNQFGVKGAYSYNEKIKGYKYDPELGKKMLADAGYKDGFKTKINVNSRFQSYGLFMQDALKKIGIEADLNILQPSEMDILQKNDAAVTAVQGIIVHQGGGQLDFTTNYIRLYSNEGIKNGNLMNYPKEYLDALHAARDAKTLADKKVALQEASRLMIEEHCLLSPLCVIPNNVYHKENLKGTNIFQTTFYNWTPEEVYFEK